MGAVYKKELRSSFTTMTGPVAIAVMLFIAGYMFRTYNLHFSFITFVIN